MKRKITVVAALLIVATIVVAAVAIKQIERPDMASYTAQAQKIFDQARSEVEHIRNVTLPNDITLHVITQQQAVDMWGTPSGETDLTNLYRQEKIYKGLFMMSENDSLYQATSDWTANWAAATVGKNDIYVLYENFDPWDMPNAEATFVHEFTHIWEPQLVTPTTFDTDKAHTALVEGDSSHMGDYYKAQYNAHAAPANLPTIDGVSTFLLDNPKLDAVYPIPSTISSLNWFPYIQGKAFVVSLINDGGWARLNQAYDAAYTPSTTEQILHTGKYFTNESAIPTSSPALADDTWTRISTTRGQNSDSYGEYFIQVMLGNWLKSGSAQEALNASAGWGGDNFTYYEKGNDFLFTWNITWDSVQDASQFNQAFTHMMSLTGATAQDTYQWFSNGRYLSLIWNPDTASTLIACSTNQTTVQPSFFK